MVLLDAATSLSARCRPTRSIYALSRSEITKGVANRFVHSRTYILMYLTMAALSVTTVVLSLGDGCPGFAFYVLEVVINTTMIAEVGIRLVAFGRVSAFSTCYTLAVTRYLLCLCVYVDQRRIA